MNIIRVRTQILTTRLHRVWSTGCIIGDRSILRFSGQSSYIVIPSRNTVNTTWCKEIPITETLWGDAE